MFYYKSLFECFKIVETEYVFIPAMPYHPDEEEHYFKVLEIEISSLPVN